MKKSKPWTIERVAKEYLPFFTKFGVTESEIYKLYHSWDLTQKKDIKDFVWYLFQSILENVGRSSSSLTELHSKQKEIYSQMLFFRRKFYKAKANEILQLFLESDIESHFAETSLILKIEIISGYCCPYCNELNGKVFSYKEVMENKYLGSQKCTNELGCNCTYAFQPQRDKNGRLILRES